MKSSRALKGIGLTSTELRRVAALSAIFGLRLLGLFLLLPVLSPYALTLEGSTPFLAGLAVGAYGLTQTLFQMPLGMLSDRWGRKPAILLGQALFASGAVAAASARGIHGLIGGRLFQGAGAISGVVVATVADSTREEVRGRAMALVGVTIGLSFALGFALGPPIAARKGVPFLFWLLVAFELAAAAYVALALPAAPPSAKAKVSLSSAVELLADPPLWRLNLLMFILHVGMTAVFVATPVLLQETWARADLWKLYLPMLAVAGGVMIPSMMLAESKGRLKAMIGAGVLVACAGFFMMAGSGSAPGLLATGLVAYFVGFNLVEPVLPSLVTRFAPASLRGTAVGLFNMSQFFGAFCGGALGGAFLGWAPRGLYVALAALALPWAWALATLEDPASIREARFPGAAERGTALELRKVRGIYDARWGDGGLEVRFSAARLDEAGLEAILREKGYL